MMEKYCMIRLPRFEIEGVTKSWIQKIWLLQRINTSFLSDTGNYLDKYEKKFAYLKNQGTVNSFFSYISKMARRIKKTNRTLLKVRNKIYNFSHLRNFHRSDHSSVKSFWKIFMWLLKRTLQSGEQATSSHYLLSVLTGPIDCLN